MPRTHQNSFLPVIVEVIEVVAADGAAATWSDTTAIRFFPIARRYNTTCVAAIGSAHAEWGTFSVRLLKRV